MGERVCGQQCPALNWLANRRQHVGHFSAKDGARDSRNISSAGSPCADAQGVLAKCRDVLPRGGASTGTKVISGIVPSAVDMVPGRADGTDIAISGARTTVFSS